MMKKITFFISLAVSSVLFNSCSGPAEEKSVELTNLVLTAEGPLYEGSNTFQTTVTEPLKKFLSENGLTAENIQEIKVAKCVLTATDSNAFNMYSGINVQLFSDNSEMQNVAVVNPVPENKEQIEAKVAAEQEKIADIFKDKDVYVVGDALLKEDVEDNLQFTVSLTLNVKHDKTK